MNNLLELARKNLTAIISAGAALIVGLLVGWLLLGWVVWPVEWTDASAAYLRKDMQEDYVRLVAVAYGMDHNSELATTRILELGPAATEAISRTMQSSDMRYMAYGGYVAQLQFMLASTNALAPAAQTPKAATGLGNLALPLIACCGVLVVGLIAGVIIWRMSQNQGSPAARTGRSTVYTPLAGEAGEASGLGEAVGRFMTTYTLGDDVYDDSFSVDGPDGNFLGECGMGISETIGVGDPKKVTAFEVWLFDKNDIRTVTRVVMSEHAFRDEALKSRLAAKGEPVLARAGDTVNLETQTLVVTARVVDIGYGGGALPPNSFFERLTIELAAYRKPEAAVAEPVAAAAA